MATGTSSSWSAIQGLYWRGFSMRVARSLWNCLIVVGALTILLLLTGVCGPTLAGDLRLTPSLTLSETYSDNVDLDPDGQEEKSFISAITPGFQLRYDAPRVTAALDNTTTIVHQTGGENKGFNLRPDVAGFATTEIAEDQIFVDMRASVSRQLIDTDEADAESNRETVQVYTVSPYLVHRFGGFADAELRYTFNQVFVDEDDGQANNDTTSDDDMTHALSLTTSSGDDFNKFRWSLIGSASNTSRSDDGDIEQSEARLDVEYLVGRSIALLGSIGYQTYDDGDARNDVDGPTWQAGFRYNPNPRLELRATYGERDGDGSLNADVQYQIGAWTTFTAGYAEIFETGQERVSRDLSFIATDPETGNLIDTRTGLPFDPNTGATNLSSETTRTKRFTAAVTYNRDRNSIRVAGTVEDRIDQTGDDDDEEVNLITLSFTRQVSRDTSLQLFGSYKNSTFEDEDREDDEFMAGASASHNFRENFTGFVSYTYRNIDSTDVTKEYSENRFTIEARLVF